MAVTTNFDVNRTFGVEIEFTHVSNADIYLLADRLSQAGVTTNVEGYNHITRRSWKIVTDASVRNPIGRGWELVSPPLKGTEGLEAIETACKVLREFGAKVNRSCGLHVHHDARDWGVKEFKNFYRLYGRMERTLDAAMPKSRRSSSNMYCRSIRTQLRHGLQAFEACETVEELRNFWNASRYYKVNMESWWRHRTIEVRHHSGTIDAEKIVNWVVFTQLMVRRAEKSRKLKVNLENQRYARTNPWRLVAVELALHNKGREMDEYVKSAIEWVASRITHFRGLEAAAA